MHKPLHAGQEGGAGCRAAGQTGGRGLAGTLRCSLLVAVLPSMPLPVCRAMA